MISVTCEKVAVLSVAARHPRLLDPYIGYFIRRNMTPGQRARFNSPISAQQRVLDELRTRGLAPAKKPRAPKPANDLDQANARIVELEEELKSARSIAPVTDIAEHAAERVNADGALIPSSPCDGNFEAFRSRWVQYCAADFAALSAAMQARFVTEVLNLSVPSGDPSPPSLPFSVQLASMMRM